MGCILTGYLSDRFGGAPMLVVGSVLLGAATYALYTVTQTQLGLLMLLYAIAGSR